MFKEDENRYRRVALREISAEASCDYVLPDYLGDVRKILFTEARCLPLPTYMSGEEISTSGAVEFRMIYTDSEGRLSSVSFTEDYESSERVLSETSPEISSESEVSSFSMRLLGPRKISAKARVSTSARLLFDERVELCGRAAELSSLETARRCVSAMNFLAGESSEREYAEAMAMLEGVTLEDARVIYERCESRISECRATAGEVVVSGEHLVSAIIANCDECAELYEKSIPFSEVLKLEGVCEDMSASVSVIYPSLKIEVTPSETGVSVCASLIAEYTPSAIGNRPLEMIADGYLTDRECECRYDRLELARFVDRRCFEDTEEASADPSSLSLENLESILFTSAEARVKNVETVGGVLKITSDIRFSGIACEKNGDGATTYAPIRHTVECTKDIPLEAVSLGESCPAVSLGVSDVRGRVTDGVPVLCARLSYLVELASKEEHRHLCEIDFTSDPEEKQEDGKITVYYPDAEDTLFSVARKFRTTSERIAIDNSLSEAAVSDGYAEGSLRGVEMLIIK